MADMIWGQRFFNRSDTPAWHGKGINRASALTANAALDLVGRHNVRLERCVIGIGDTATGGRKYAKTGYAHIVRESTPDDDREVVFGEPVSMDYELITPSDAANIWDATIVEVDGKTLPVETLGILKNGQELFITSKITRFAVKDDEIDMYIGMFSPMYSNLAAKVFSTGVRVVCQNTLKIGLANAVHKAVIPHTPGAKEVVSAWLRDIYAKQSGIVATAKVDMQRMAETPLKSAALMEYLNQVYPNPTEPDSSWVGRFNNSTTLERFQELYHERMKSINATREAVVGLFAGDSQTLNTQATRDTLFGAFNAVSEYEDNRRGSSPEHTVHGVLVGDRGEVIAKAYSTALAFCSN